MSRRTLARYGFSNPALRFTREGNDGGGGGTSGGGSGGNDGGTGGSTGSGGGSDGGSGGSGGSAGGSSGGDAVDDEGKPLGFPLNTPVEQMSDKQAAAYWRNMSKNKQKEADARKDYDQQKADAEKWRQLQEEQKTPSQKQIDEAILRGKKEAAADNALSMVSVILTTRGKSDKEASDLLEFVNPQSLLTSDGGVDRQKVTNLADKLVPASSSSGGGNLGQGRYESQSVTGKAAGQAEAERRGYLKKS